MSELTVGIDYEAGEFRTATAGSEAGRLIVKELVTRKELSQIDGDGSASLPMILAVPDREVIVRPLHLPGGGNGSENDRLLFELASSLLDDAAAFNFSLVPTGVEHIWLGLAFRKERCEALARQFGLDPATSDSDLAYQMRAVALGQGYLTFAHRPEGDLVGLVDVGRDAISICLVYRHHIVDLGWLAGQDYDLSIPNGQAQLAIDLKTVINMKAAALMDRGVSVPLARLFLGGSQVSEGLCQKVQEYFPAGLDSLLLHSGFFNDLAPDAGEKPESYLIPLGLTVN